MTKDKSDKSTPAVPPDQIDTLPVDITAVDTPPDASNPLSPEHCADSKRDTFHSKGCPKQDTGGDHAPPGKRPVATPQTKSKAPVAEVEDKKKENDFTESDQARTHSIWYRSQTYYIKK